MPVSVSTPENINMVHNVILLISRIVPKQLSILWKRVYHIVFVDLGMSKKFAEWIFKSLHVGQKSARMETSYSFYARFGKDADFLSQQYGRYLNGFLLPIVRLNGNTLVLQCLSNFRVQKSIGNVTSLFSSCQWIDLLDKDKTVFGNRHSTLLTTLRERIVGRRPGK